MSEPGSRSIPEPVPMAMPATTASSAPQPRQGPTSAPGMEPAPMSMPMPMPMHVTLSGQMTVSEPVYMTMPEPLLLSGAAPSVPMPVPAPAPAEPASQPKTIKFVAVDMYGYPAEGFTTADAGKSAVSADLAETLQGIQKKVDEASAKIMTGSIQDKVVFSLRNLLFIFDGAPYMENDIPSDTAWRTTESVVVTFLFPPGRYITGVTDQQVADARPTIAYRRTTHINKAKKNAKDIEEWKVLREFSPVWARPRFAAM
ncbi:hypothetical protein LPJ60_004182 [Coemansia sp. RSA 2675]|nr:hypothetical protein LPJ60_004182 [Coemansia sp. RSA 2675]